MNSRGKREHPVSVRMPELLKLALREAASREDRTVSTFIVRMAESHPVVQIALQQIGARRGNQ